MKILLDNCVPYRAKLLFSGHEVSHTADLGWEELRNGALLATASSRFDLLVTTDKKIQHEQNLESLPLPVLELNTRFTRLADLQVLASHIAAALDATACYRFVSVSADGTLVLPAKRE